MRFELSVPRPPDIKHDRELNLLSAFLTDLVAEIPELEAFYATANSREEALLDRAEISPEGLKPHLTAPASASYGFSFWLWSPAPSGDFKISGIFGGTDPEAPCGILINFPKSSVLNDPQLQDQIRALADRHFQYT